MLFYAFKMAVLFVSFCINASDVILCSFMHSARSEPIFQIYMDPPTGVPGASKNQNFSFTNKSVEFLPQNSNSKNIKNEVFGFELFSVHLTL